MHNKILQANDDQTLWNVHNFKHKKYRGMYLYRTSKKRGICGMCGSLIRQTASDEQSNQREREHKSTRRESRQCAVEVWTVDALERAAHVADVQVEQRVHHEHVVHVSARLVVLVDAHEVLDGHVGHRVPAVHLQFDARFFCRQL